MHIVGDLNLNVLDYEKNKKVKNFFNLMFQHNLIPIINKPTRITKRNATAIDHIITNSYLSSNIETGIIKTDVSDHFPIFLIAKKTEISVYPTTTKIQKRIINDKSILKFNIELNKTNWDHVIQIKNSNEAYESFLTTFLPLYNKFFPKITYEVKTKTLLSPWMTRGLLKSSKKKQKLYEKYLKSRTNKNDTNYKAYKHLFEQLKNRSKKNHYENLLIKYRSNIKKTWDVIKEVIGKTKIKNNAPPRSLIINTIETYDQKTIANNFNDFFVNVGLKLAANIPASKTNYKTYLDFNNSVLPDFEVDKEFETAYFSLKRNKSAGYDEIS